MQREVERQIREVTGKVMGMTRGEVMAEIKRFAPAVDVRILQLQRQEGRRIRKLNGSAVTIVNPGGMKTV
jgi:hypothetical protein